MQESPKFLCSIGRDADAVAVIHKIAEANGRTCTLTVEQLHEAAKPFFRVDGDGDQQTTKFSTWGLVTNSLKCVYSRRERLSLTISQWTKWGTRSWPLCHASTGVFDLAHYLYLYVSSLRLQKLAFLLTPRP